MMFSSVSVETQLLLPRDCFQGLNMLSLHYHFSSMTVILRMVSFIDCLLDYDLLLLAPVSWLLGRHIYPHGNSILIVPSAVTLTLLFFFFDESFGKFFTDSHALCKPKYYIKSYLLSSNCFTLWRKSPQVIHFQLIYHSLFYILSTYSF
jgi:hypothetical protein